MRNLIRRLARTAWTCTSCGNTNRNDASNCACGKSW